MPKTEKTTLSGIIIDIATEHEKMLNSLEFGEIIFVLTDGIVARVKFNEKKFPSNIDSTQGITKTVPLLKVIVDEVLQSKSKINSLRFGEIVFTVAYGCIAEVEFTEIKKIV